MNGNIALSMEIGSAYALQVCLLQIPALVAWSAYSMATFPADQINTHTFTYVAFLFSIYDYILISLNRLIFPQWDLVTVILCVFLLSYMYGEGKSNYFKVSSMETSIYIFTCWFAKTFCFLLGFDLDPELLDGDDGFLL